MAENNMILNHFFTKNAFSELVFNNNNSLYCSIIQRYINNPEDKNNEELISEIYSFMSKQYRNEYFFQNTLLNKLLLGKHSVNTTTALMQIPIGKSKADFILINGKAVVYEIKTDLDTFDRLKTQLCDYFKAFTHVCVVTSTQKYDEAYELLKDSSVGIYALTEDERISQKKQKEPFFDDSKLDYRTIFKILHKTEYEQIILDYFEYLPNVPPVFYFEECFNLFSKIPMKTLYGLFLKELQGRNRIQKLKIEKIPYELKSLVYFSKPNELEWSLIDNFLTSTFK